MKTLIIITVMITLPSIAAAQELGNGMGTQASATPNGLSASDPNRHTSAGIRHSHHTTHRGKSHDSNLTNSDKSTSGNVDPH